MKSLRQLAFLTVLLGVAHLGAWPLRAQNPAGQPGGFDPYGAGGFVSGWGPGAPLFPVYIDGGPGGSIMAPPGYDPYAIGGSTPSSTLGSPYDSVAPPIIAPPGTGFPPSGYPSTVPSYNPNSFPAYNGSNAWAAGADGGLYDPNRTWEQFLADQPVRLVEGPRFRHTWLAGGNDDNDLDMNNSDISVVFNWPNFLWTRQPLHIAPSFSLHQWDGPVQPMAIAADLPEKAYSAFVDLGWESPWENKFGAELGLRGGAFADFSSLEDDSWRLMGKGLLRLRLGENMMLRGGVYYLDRVDVKLLPAGGVTWTPNPMTRFDIFFPNPKLAQYLTTAGSNDIWWYLAGEYGDGSWTVRRDVNGAIEQVDINDFRVMIGIEWGAPPVLRAGRRMGFFEAGWVFERELVYKDRPMDNLSLGDTFMLRAGIGY